MNKPFRRVDLALCHPPRKPTVFIEVKQPGKTEDADRQLFEYGFHEGVPIAVLTDGQTWSFYLPAEQGSYKARRVYKLDLTERTIEESVEKLNRYLQNGRIITGEAFVVKRGQVDFSPLGKSTCPLYVPISNNKRGLQYCNYDGDA